jgi:TonB family protein
MHPVDQRRPQRQSPVSPPQPPVPLAGSDPPSDLDGREPPDGRDPVISAPLRLTGPALLVAARFRDITLATRLLRSDEARTFSIGNARGADAPVNPAWLPEMPDPLAPRRHLLVEPTPGGFVLNLTSAMRAVLQTELQALPLGPDLGRADAPLMLPPGSHLLVPCGEVTFDLQPAEPAATLPRPWLPAGWRRGVKYPLVVAILLALLMAIAHLIPSDPRALSLDTLDASSRMARLLTVPLEVTAPEIDRARALKQAAGGGGSPAAPKPSGQAGDKRSRDTNHRLAIQGTARPEDVRALSARIRQNSLLAVLDGPRGSALTALLDDGPAMGADAESVVGNLIAANPGAAYGLGGLGMTGTGAGAAGEHEGTIGGGGPLGTVGVFGRGSGSGPGYGTGVGALHARKAIVPDPVIGKADVQGTLDKEIIRRVVRRHLNEVKYCYQQALSRRPTLEGRLVTQFTIAPTGHVLAAFVQSSTLRAVEVEACVVNAVKRWEFPEPNHGGLAMVSYPFTFAPAGD